jgi:2-polyprenyl-3-methyl-5-hydroxy-6-metoxy-1,4-benzoquinol methylase
MSSGDQARWDAKHSESGASEEPSAFLRNVIEGEAWRISRGAALDVACGKGRNAIFLARKGFQVAALDISAVALAEGRRRADANGVAIDWRQCDLEDVELGDEEYDLIVKINYLQRSLIPPLKRALKKDGCIICETYLIDQKEIGQPSNPAFLLARNELLGYFRDFRVLQYREGNFVDGAAPAFRAGILAQKIG